MGLGESTNRRSSPDRRGPRASLRPPRGIRYTPLALRGAARARGARGDLSSMGRALDCGSRGYGFEPHRSPQLPSSGSLHANGRPRPQGPPRKSVTLALCPGSRSSSILALRVGLEARTARLADQHGVLAQPGRPLRWAAGLIALFAIAASLLAYSGYQSQSGRVDRRGRAAGPRRGSRRRPLRAGPPPDAQRDRRRCPRSCPANPTEIEPGPRRPRRRASSASTRSSRGSTRTASSRLAATATPVRRSTSATARTSRPRSPARRRSARACSGPSTSPRSSHSSSPRMRADGTVNGAVGSGIRLGPEGAAAESLRFAGGADVVVVDQAGQVIAGPHPIDGLEPVAAGFPLAAMRDDADGGVLPLGDGTVRGRRRAARLRPRPERRLARPRAAAGGGGVRPRDRRVRAPARPHPRRVRDRDRRARVGVAPARRGRAGAVGRVRVRARDARWSSRRRSRSSRSGRCSATRSWASCRTSCGPP